MIYSDSWPSFGEDDQEALRLLVRRILKPGCRILEIGSWLGSGSTRIIIEELKSVEDGKLYCVDTWKGSKNVPRHQDILAHYDVFGTFLHNVRAAGGEERVHPLVMSSSNAAMIVADGCMDLIFIDADHSYTSTSQDISLWKSKVRGGGILCGHDCECRPVGALRDVIYSSLEADHIAGEGTPFAVVHPGVVAAVDEAFGESAHLWGEAPLRRSDGTDGRATIWDITVPVKNALPS